MIFKFVGHPEFDSEIHKLPAHLHELVVNRINNISNTTQLLTPTNLKLKYDVVHVKFGVVQIREVDLNIIVSMDEDLLFDRTTINLLRLIGGSQLDIIFHEELNKFYGGLLISYDKGMKWN